VRDRVLHQAIFRILYPIFDKHFIYHSYSSRVGKGTHKGVRNLYVAIRKVSNNWKYPAYALKCDIRKFFDSINHEILLKIIKEKIKDEQTIDLIILIIESFEKEKGRGLPLGNVTSQLFANIYLNELDQFIKHGLKVKYYFRYADDFVILDKNRKSLDKLKGDIESFLNKGLKLKLHEDKVFIKKVSQGIDFLGYVILPSAIVLRTKTKRRILKRVNNANMSSYKGVLSHCKSKRILSDLSRIVKNH
jgi:RNA-directed DNA polymerase